MPSRVEILRSILAQHRNMGLMPAELHANVATVSSFVAEANLRPIVPPDNRSLLSRLGRAQEAPAPIYEFENCRLVPNPRIPGQAIIVRPRQLMDDPDWIDHIKFQNAQTAQERPIDLTATPWHQKVEEVAQGGDDTSLDALTRGAGVNCTSVLMKAMDDLDKIEDVVVLRFYRNKSIDLCSTLNHFGVVGALQKALGHVMNSDGD